MPPKKSLSTKRKLATEDESEVDVLVPPSVVSKKAKTADNAADGKEDPLPTGNGQPNNKVLPINIVFPQRAENALRIAAWNVTSLASSQKKGFKNYVEAEDADILVLTETKVNNEPVDPVLASRYPYRYWSISETKSYAGTAILSKHQPLSITKVLPGHKDSKFGKGRIVTLEFEKCYIVGTYVVNAGEKLKTMDGKKDWNATLEAYLRDLDSKKPVIWTGDLNVAPTEKDLANAKRNWNKTAGYTEAETSWFANFLQPTSQALNIDPTPDGSSAVVVPQQPFADVWRDLHPDLKHYSYFSFRFNARVKRMGWRLDMFVLSDRIKNSVKMCEIRDEIWGASDHCPIVMEIDRNIVLGEVVDESAVVVGKSS